MDLPTYTVRQDNENKSYENYQNELNQTLRDNLGQLGFCVTNITDADLRTNSIVNPETGTSTTIAALAPVGSIWFVTDAATPCWVGKQDSVPTLVKFTVTAYP